MNNLIRLIATFIVFIPSILISQNKSIVIKKEHLFQFPMITDFRNSDQKMLKTNKYSDIDYGVPNTIKKDKDIVILYKQGNESAGSSQKPQSTLTMGYLKGVYSIQSNYDISSVKLYMQVPIIHRKTTPVFFYMLESSQPSKIVDFKTVSKGNNNLIAEVSFNDLSAGDYIVIPWECWTLKKNNSFSDIPYYIDKSLLGALDDSLDQFLQSSIYIQSDHSEIVRKAENLAGGSQNIVEIADSIIHFTGETILYQSYGLQDALSTLQRGYAVCTGKANLAVALLRAVGIPARVLMVAFTHYITELYLPDYGWVRGESTQAVFPQPVENNTVMMVCTQKEENYSGYGGVMCYWGVSDPRASYNIEYSKVLLDEIKYEVNIEDSLLLQQTIHSTKSVWHQYNIFLNHEKSSQQDDLFAQALSHQEQSVYYFGEDNLQGYLDEIHSAQEKYNQIENLSVIADGQLNREYQLYQNYPNPFNSSTQISYSIPFPGQVLLILYDIRGREIKTLVDEFQSADTYTISVDLSEFSSGIYLYSLNIGSYFSEIKKMLLVR